MWKLTLGNDGGPLGIVSAAAVVALAAVVVDDDDAVEATLAFGCLGAANAVATSLDEAPASLTYFWTVLRELQRPCFASANTKVPAATAAVVPPLLPELSLIHI